MAFVYINPNKYYPFIPESQKDEENPVTLMVKPMNNEKHLKMKAAIHKRTRQLTGDDKENALYNGIEAAGQIQKEVFEENVGQVLNFYYEGEEEGSEVVSITTGVEFYKYGPVEWVEEAIRFMDSMGGLDAKQKKT
jgi:hypothetical protein